jgi:hypothetical protein
MAPRERAVLLRSSRRKFRKIPFAKRSGRPVASRLRRGRASPRKQETGIEFSGILAGSTPLGLTAVSRRSSTKATGRGNVRMHIRKGNQELAALARLVSHPARWIAWSGRSALGQFREHGRRKQARVSAPAWRSKRLAQRAMPARSQTWRRSHVGRTALPEPIAFASSVLEVPAPPGPRESRFSDPPEANRRGAAGLARMTGDRHRLVEMLGNRRLGLAPLYLRAPAAFSGRGVRIAPSSNRPIRCKAG